MSTTENIQWSEDVEEKQITITLDASSRLTIEDVKRAITELQTGDEGEKSGAVRHERGYSA